MVEEAQTVSLNLLKYIYKDKTAHIKAYKFILAGVSPVFRKKFFGPSKDNVEIKETTIEAFTTLINYI